MKSRWLLYILTFLVLFSLQACMNPGDPKAMDHVAYQAQITEVQEAVNAYKKDTGVLPIKNSTPSTPLFEQNRIDFNRLVPQYLPKPPFNAYEEGGYFQYLIVTPETHPTIKVYDLTFTSTIQDIEHKIDVFRYNKGYSPVAKILANGRYTIDYKALGYASPPYVISPYSGQHLEFFMDSKSKVYINYLPDIYTTIKKSKGFVKPGEDLRPLLYKSSPYVPIASVPYGLNNKGEVDFILNHVIEIK
jgi:hypothetical protein